MSYAVNITHSASRDIEEAADYIEYSLKNPDAADKLLKAIEEKLETLTNYPKKYALVSDELLSARGVRFLQIGNYMAFYVIDEADRAVYVIRFLYNRRDWKHLLVSDYTR